MSSHVKEFVDGVFDKVKIALALSITLNTPPGKTSQEHAQELQAAVYKHWQNDDDPFEERTVGRSLVERMHLRSQQQTVASQLSLLIPSSEDSSKCTAISQDSGYNSCQTTDDDGMDSALSSLFSDYLKPLDFSEDVRKTLGANLDFIRGIVRLKALTGNDEIVGQRFDCVIKEINYPTCESQRDLPDTGAVCRIGRPNYTVTSGVVQYILQTTSAEMIVKKSVQDVQRHLCGIALNCTELTYILSNWEGSLLQHCMAVIRKLSAEKNFQKAIVVSTSGLATVLITDMMKNYGLEKNIKLENQITLLLQLCGNSVICSEVLKIVIQKIDLISTKYEAMYQTESTCTPIERTVYFENSYYIFNLTEKLLTKYFTNLDTDQLPTEHSLLDKREEKKITDLWRGVWEKNDGPKTTPKNFGQQLTDNKMLVKSWQVSLGNAAKVFSFNYPLITIYANNCLEIIMCNEKPMC